MLRLTLKLLHNPKTAVPGRCSISWCLFRSKNMRLGGKDQLSASTSSVLLEDDLKKKSLFLGPPLPPKARVHL